MARRRATLGPQRPPRLLSMAGSDSGGGAGIQADLKAFARCGAHGMTAITAITAQNTEAVTAVHPVAPQAVVDQVWAVTEDIGVDAVKVGMLGDVATIDAVHRALDLTCDAPVVVDPVMVSESGSVLLAEDARQALRDRVLPRAAVVTPNHPEARVLARAGEDVDVRELARRIHALGPGAVVITGGHREQGTDLFFDGSEFTEIAGLRHPDGAAHGSGCTHSSALAAYLAHGHGPLEAARRARVVASEAVRDGLRGIGHGPGPVDALGIALRAVTASAAPGATASGTPAVCHNRRGATGRRPTKETE
ncbi:MAG: bifunctional hydroxymethylpyrimidine kinase/phosphomethylpyrimidine kinase [Thermoleophilaceae bacterium]